MIKSDEFCMQGRTVQALSESDAPVLATQFQAFAMKSHLDNSSAITLEINNNRTGIKTKRNHAG